MEGEFVGSEIHGFRTLQELDVPAIMEEAASRWLRPNEIHALLRNYKHFNINVKPVNMPTSGTILFFDRKMLRNFRKDGHNWKKKKDGKTVKEAHEHLKVGNEERIHVYYAHGQDNSTFVRRCYWLLDKCLEHIVLVHYRETQEQLQGSPVTTPNSNSSSVSDPSAPWPLSEELDSGNNHGCYATEKHLLECGNSLTVRNHEQRLHDINTLEWDELLETNDSNILVVSRGTVSSFYQQNQVAENDSISCGASNISSEVSSFDNFADLSAGSVNFGFNLQESGYVQPMGSQLNTVSHGEDSMGVGNSDSLDVLASDSLHSQDSFGRWMDQIITDSPGPVAPSALETSISREQNSLVSSEINDLQTSFPEQIFSITDVSPVWAYSNEKTKILVAGFFHQGYLHHAKSNLLCVCGDICTTVEAIQDGVYRCWLSPHSPGLVNIFMSFDGHKPISQILNFEYHTPRSSGPVVSSEDDKHEEFQLFQLQMRLAHLLFATSKNLDILSSKLSPNNLKEAKKFALKTSHISSSWSFLFNSVEDNKIAFAQAKDSVLKLIVRSKLKEWLLERVVDGSKAIELDVQGQGVIHLCAILDYTWAIYLFSWSGLSLDFRDKHGWTALHWAAYCGREKMVASLLSAGAKPNLVTDPTSENPGGRTAADLAAMKGYEGLAAYLSEKALIEQFEAMKVAGNVSGTLQSSTDDTANLENLAEDQLYLKDTLAAYRTSADAAARIQSALREHSLKQRTKAVQSSIPEIEARNIIAAMKIQHVFRNYKSKRKLVAAARIQHMFRIWKIRREFLNKRHQAIKIQAAFRGFQVRKQYCKILWSVGVIEKVILRWRLKRKGLRGLQVNSVETAVNQLQESDAEEDFYQTSRKQAEERVERSVVCIQAMFRSKKAQQEYRRMKLTHKQAKLYYEGLLNPDTDMDC